MQATSFPAIKALTSTSRSHRVMSNEHWASTAIMCTGRQSAHLIVEVPTHRQSQQSVIILWLELVEGLVSLEGAGLEGQAWGPLHFHNLKMSLCISSAELDRLHNRLLAPYPCHDSSLALTLSKRRRLFAGLVPHLVLPQAAYAWFRLWPLLPQACHRCPSIRLLSSMLILTM